MCLRRRARGRRSAGATGGRGAGRRGRHRERYTTERPEGWLEDYESAYRDFRFTSHMRKLAWTESIQNSVSYAYMDGRQNLRATVMDRGFGLG